MPSGAGDSMKMRFDTFENLKNIKRILLNIRDRESE